MQVLGFTQSGVCKNVPQMVNFAFEDRVGPADFLGARHAFSWKKIFDGRSILETIDQLRKAFALIPAGVTSRCQNEHTHISDLIKMLEIVRFFIRTIYS